MPGLLPQQQQAPAPQQGDDAYQFLDNAFKIMYESEESLVEVLAPLETNDPVAGLAYAGMVIVSKLLESSHAAGKELDVETVGNGGQEIIADIAKISEARGGRAFSDEEMAEALQLFVELFRETGEGSGGQQQQPAPARSGLMPQQAQQGV